MGDEAGVDKFHRFFACDAEVILGIWALTRWCLSPWWRLAISYQWSTRSRPETALFARSRSRPEICFRNFGSDRDFTDVTLAHVDEREEFSHRNILSSASTKKLAQTKYIEINLSIVLLVQLPLFPQPHLPEEGEVGLQHHQVHHLLAPVPGVRSLQQCNS